MSVSRRRFIELSSLATASMFVPKFLKAFENKPMNLPGHKVLVVVQLSGGNDGLNTVIPYRNDIYYKSRPLIGIKREEALSLSDEVGLNPMMKGIKALYDKGYVSIVNGVGYANPNRSHFRSMDIWQSASGADELVTSGWLGRYLDNACSDCDKHNAFAIEVDDTLSLAMKGKQRNAIAVQDINQFHNAAGNLYFGKLIQTHEQEHDAQLASYLYRILSETISAADYVYQQNKIYAGSQAYPNTAIGKHMKTIGSLINAGAETRVYYVSHGSFDTHVDQKNRQNKLFTELDDSLSALVADLQCSGRFNDVMIMTFSEFGRRVAQNASNGTDHGTANSMFLISGGLKKAGLYNSLPDLNNLDAGDMKYNVDFKQVYATVLDKWMNVVPKEILAKSYDIMSFI